MVPRIAFTLCGLVLLAVVAVASANVSFAQKLDAGTELDVRLANGQRFRATLIDARVDALVVRPHTRRPVPVQPVSYD